VTDRRGEVDFTFLILENKQLFPSAGRFNRSVEGAPTTGPTIFMKRRSAAFILSTNAAGSRDMRDIPSGYLFNSNGCVWYVKYVIALLW
jgi:hypothetical protein